MRRTAAALLYLLTVPAGPLWAQGGRTFAAGRGAAPVSLPLSSPALAPLTPAGPLADGLAPVPLDLPAAAADVLAASLPAVAPAAAVLGSAVQKARPAAEERGPASPAPDQARGPSPETARGRLDAAAESAGELSAKPGSAEADGRAADFTLPSLSSARGAEPVAPVVSGPGLGGAGLRPPGGLSEDEEPPSGPPPAAVSSPAGGRSLWAFLAGTFGNQLANNALQVTLPMVLLRLSDSLGVTAAVVAASGWLDSLGTLLGGWLADRVHPRTVLAAAGAGRALLLAAIPALFGLDLLGVPAAVGLYLADSLLRGVADASRHTMVVALADGGGKEELKRVKGSYQSAFEAGALLGPFAAGGLLLAVGFTAANWLVPAGFAAAALFYAWMPRGSKGISGAEPGSPLSAFRSLASQPLKLALLGLLLATVYPLRSILPAAFADSVLHQHGAIAWLTGAFGIGGLLGALVYRAWGDRRTPSFWLAAGAAGSLVLALAWLPAAFWPMALGIAVFAAANVMARQVLEAEIQRSVAPGQAGSVMGLMRFSSNLTAMGVKTLAGLAFLAAVQPAAGFALIGAGLAAFALAKLWVSRRLAKLALAASLIPAAHGLPGKLIVVEGLDGSGKSTQMELLKRHFEAQGLEVVVTAANTSQLLSDAVKRAKKTKGLTPRTFSLTQATDLADRLDHVILPALKRGAIVLSDRYFYTGLARDRARGMDRGWLRQLYSFAIRPDKVLYFRAPVEVAIGRVLKRSEERLKLSENFEPEDDGAGNANGPKVKFYEGGLDMGLSEDPVENFRLFQTRVADEYDSLAPEFGFTVLDAQRPIDEQHRAVLEEVLPVLGPLDGYARKAPEPENLFDKDPAGDAEQIRANYVKKSRGLEFYFRNAFFAMQRRFAELVPHAGMPKVFLHGNPHVDNYAKTREGAAMVDFDRSRVGPYAWDLVRFLVSLSVSQKNPNGALLHPSVLAALRRGYLEGFRHPEKGYQEMKALRDVEPKADERSTKAYVKAEKKWVREMRETPLPVDDRKVQALLRGLLAYRGEEGLLERYRAAEAGRGFGSMGERDRVLVLLVPKDEASKDRWIMLDIKEVRSDGDSEWYTSPVPTDGERMLRASELYAPEWERRPGYTTYEGRQYFGRQIPTQNVKLKRKLTLEELEDLAYAAATQLGRGHRLSLEGAEPQVLARHLERWFDRLVEAAWTMKKELEAAHRRYLERMREGGLWPREETAEEA